MGLLAESVEKQLEIVQGKNPQSLLKAPPFLLKLR